MSKSYWDIFFGGPPAETPAPLGALGDGPTEDQWLWDLNELLDSGQITEMQYKAAVAAGEAAVKGKEGWDALDAAGLAIKKLLPDVWPLPGGDEDE